MSFLDYQIVSVIDPYIHHAVAVYRQDKVCAGSDEACRYRHLIDDILFSKDRLACGDSSDHRKCYRIK